MNALRSLIPIGFVAWLGYAAATSPALFASFGLVGLAHGAIYALIGVGFGITYTIGRFINFSHGDVFMIGAVGSVWLAIDVLDAKRLNQHGLAALAAAIVLAAVTSAGVSCASEALVYRRLRGSTTFVAVVASVGVALILQNIGIKWNGSARKSFPSLIPEAGLYTQPGTVVAHAAATLAISLPALALAMWAVQRTATGRALRAVSDDPDAAAMMGINVSRTIMVGFAAAGACAGVAGALYAQEFHAVSYGIGMKVGLVAYASAVIGGVGRTLGTVVGGLTIGVVESLNAWLPAGLGPHWGQSVIFSVMILMLVYKPEGLLGTPSTART